FLLYPSPRPPALPSFPTRRSSDLDAEHLGLVAALGDDVGVAHLRIEIDRLAGLKHFGFVEFGVDLDPPLQHVDIFLARMADELAELLHRLGADGGEDGDHPLPAQLRAEIMI